MTSVPPAFASLLKQKFSDAVNGHHVVFASDSVRNEEIKRSIKEKSYNFYMTELESLQSRPENGQKSQNPFEQPEPELTIISEYGQKNEFKVIFNKFPVVAEHFMLVTREFVTQNSPLLPSDLVAIYSILQELHTSCDGKQWFSFYNCGPQSGASQPHKHIQFMTLPPDYTSYVDNVVDSSEAFVPNAMTKPLCDEALPFSHFIAKLPDLGNDPEEVLAMTFVALLQRVMTVIKDNGYHEVSYNFCATTRYMMLIPRSHSHYENVIGINACGYMGLILSKSKNVTDTVKEVGFENILEKCGFPNVSSSNLISEGGY